ncbi:pyridoxamine 5 -phosphate oxidase- fmn-binding [Moniliophthora roreri MCA 2997]|uniref:Pyridoxamine 5-phosphate oxidase-fmn-binding n=1 Tax=Moniliophthora roreri (strain MCA 2997) TaxID=1381753 RepID=V2XIB7_MONRO|nr:pyridoxamine 5 -phosphate oxidase- fmn-binding [Moniliophthora roreri MCA 2997]
MASSAAPRWKAAISDALSEHSKSVVFQLATIDPSSPKPHVRSHIFRSFLQPPGNDQLPFILTTTDIRTPKATQIISNPNVELAWWIEGKQEQFRIAGTASLVPAPDHPLYKHFSGIKVLEGLNWEEKRKEVFKTMSAHMKASWCRPVPGSRLVGGEEEAKKWPVRVDEPGHERGEDGREVTEEDKGKNKENWETALKRFALLIIDPTEVDYVELGVIPNKRTRFWKSENGTWKEEAVVP